MSTDRTSDHSAPAPATRTAQMLRVASRRRRLGVRIAMAGTVAGLLTSVAAPAMAATGHGSEEVARPVVVTATAAAAQHHPKAAPKMPKAGSKVSSAQGLKLATFREAGYGYADAQVLAGYWDLSSPFDAKLAGGTKLKSGLKLPFPPKATQHR